VRLLDTTGLNLILRLIVVDWIKVWMTGQNAPSDFLFDVVRMRFGVELDGIGSFSLDVTNNVPGWNYKGMIATRANPRGFVVAGNGGS